MAEPVTKPPVIVDHYSSWMVVVSRLFVWLVIISAVLYLLSATYPFVRLIYLGTLALGLLVAGGYLGQRIIRRPWIMAVCLLVLALLVAWSACAGREPDRPHLRQAYLARLRAFVGTRYIWGGETHVGIDCSGLARVALYEAMVVCGVEEGNPRLLGPALWRFWWRDMSANAMGHGVYRYTRWMRDVPQLAELSPTTVRPGDLAVRDDGSHVLIYLGARQWIEANPEDGRVVINHATPDSPRGYFHLPMRLVSWTLLD